MTTRRSRGVAVLAVAGLALIVVGIVVMVVSTPTSASFGWFAYAPLSGAVFSPDGAVLIGWGAIVGAALAALGLAGLAFWAGFAVALSRSRRDG